VNTFDGVDYVGLAENRGGNGARNAGYRRSSGDYVQFLDDDDEMKERKLEKQVALLSSRSDTGVVYCGVETDSGVDLPDPEKQGDVLRSALHFDLYPCVTSTMLIDRDLMSQVAPLRIRPGADDNGLKIELAARTEFDFIDEPLVYHPTLDDSRGASLGAAVGREQILKEYADLYDRYPESMRRATFADTYRLKAKRLLQNNRWSARAIVAYAKEWVYSGYDPKVAALAVSSIFGRPGLTAASWAHRKLRG
jgi:glycosyltransferase involved in cell wall biosynthesis